jgi:hypothetical protein
MGEEDLHYYLLLCYSLLSYSVPSSRATYLH